MAINQDPFFFGFSGQARAKPFSGGVLRRGDYGLWMYDTRRTLQDSNPGIPFLGFDGQVIAKPFDEGMFYDTFYEHTEHGTSRFVLNPRFDDMFLGFEGQPVGKPFDVGRWRDYGEVYNIAWTKFNLYNPVFSSNFLGFAGQPTAKAFETGQWRDYGEVYGCYDTRRDVAAVVDNEYGTRRIVLVPEEEEIPYIDHVERMRQHLISEFQWDYVDGKIWSDKPVIRAFLTGVGRELDELDKAIYNLRTQRWLDKAVGKQLDGIGQIVDRPRTIDNAITLAFFGFYGQPHVQGFELERFRDVDELATDSYELADAEYRLLLAMKVRMNSALATTEDTIASIRYIFSNAPVTITEMGNARIGIGIGRNLTDNETALAQAVDMLIRAGGVGVEWRVHFRGGKTLGFAGQPYSKGFDIGVFADLF